MFGSNLKATILAYESIFKAAGFDFAANADKPDSLKAFIEQREGAARTTATAEAGTNLLKAVGLTAAEGQTADAAVKAALTAKDATITLYTTGLADAGVKPTASDAKAGLTSADIKTAIEARASQKAAATVAATGHAPLAQAAEVTGDEIPETEAELHVALNAAKDPASKGRIAARLNKLREKQWSKN